MANTNLLDIMTRNIALGLFGCSRHLFSWHFWLTLLLLLFAGTIFCEFLRFWKNRKIKSPRKFLPTHQALWCIYNQKLRDTYFSLWNMHNHSLLMVSAFSFLPSRVVTSSRKWRLMTSMTVGDSRAKLKLWFLPNNGCILHHVACFA